MVKRGKLVQVEGGGGSLCVRLQVEGLKGGHYDPLVGMICAGKREAFCIGWDHGFGGIEDNAEWFAQFSESLEEEG